MATETVAKPRTSARVHVQKFGTFLSGMIMPNIAAIIAWGIITAFFDRATVTLGGRFFEYETQQFLDVLVPFWPPGSGTEGRNGTEYVVTSDVSRAFLIADAGLGAVARRADDDDDFAFGRRIGIARGQLGQRAGHAFLVQLGQLPGDRRVPVAQSVGERGERFAEPGAAFVEHQCRPYPGDFGDGCGARVRLGREEAEEQEAIGRQPREGQGGDRRARAGDGGDEMAGGAGGADGVSGCTGSDFLLDTRWVT